jgi:endoglucanase
MQRRQALKLGTLAAGSALLPRSARNFAQAAAATLAPTETTPAIYLNQVGYPPSAQKIASVANRAADGPQTFHVVNEAGAAVFSGTLTSAQLDAASGDHIAQADFSGVTTPGTYTLVVGELRSDPIVIAPDVYKHALYLSTRMFYGQRCGCAVDLGDGYKHPICHTDGAYHASSGRSGKAKHLGGWHDAGDYGRYVVNSGISTSTLLYAFDLYPDTLRNFSLDIPPHHRHLPDILAEVRWNLDWMLSLQDPHDGGVWHKQTSEHFCAFIMPQDDKLTSYIIGSGHAPYKTTAATADLAATAALASRIYRPFDSRYADHCLKVADKAFTWAVANPNQPFENPAGVSTGGYGDSQLTDELLWAAAELFRATGDLRYEVQFLADFSAEAVRLHISEPGWGNLFSLGCFAYAQTPTAQPLVVDLIRKAFTQAADALVAASGTNGYANTLGFRDYGWGSNGACANQSVLLYLADLLAPNPAYLPAALSNLHYLLGRNCHGVSWVTQLGVRPFMHPHHRPSAADGIVAPWPGMLSGGPNRHPGDAAARTLPQMPPMRMWLDNEGAYSMNEIAINWNAPLVFLLTAANSST